MAGKLPVLKLSDFPVKLAVWEHLDEKQRPYYSASLSKTYKDKDQNWQDSQYLGDGDWAKAAALLMEAWRRLRCEERAIAPKKEPEAPADEGSIPF